MHHQAMDPQASDFALCADVCDCDMSGELKSIQLDMVQSRLHQIPFPSDSDEDDPLLMLKKVNARNKQLKDKIAVWKGKCQEWRGKCLAKGIENRQLKEEVNKFKAALRHASEPVGVRQHHEVQRYQGNPSSHGKWQPKKTMLLPAPLPIGASIKPQPKQPPTPPPRHLLSEQGCS